MQKYIYKLKFKFDQIGFRARARRALVLLLTRKYIQTDMKVKVLDYGCGTGLLQEEFEQMFKNSQAFGIDISREAIKYCKKRGLNRVLIYDGGKMPFSNNTFDVVYSIDVLEHIKNDAASLKEIRRVLKKKGIAILLVPSYKHLWSTRDLRLQHYRRYEESELAKKCQNIGFRVLTNKNVDFLPYFILKMLCWLSPKKKGVPDLKMDVEDFAKFLDSIFFVYEILENFTQQFITYPMGISQLVVIQK